MAGSECDVCGSKELFAGVASSGLGAVSFAFCKVCLSMHAEPEFMIKALIDSVNGDMSNLNCSLITYDDELDSYFDYRTDKVIPMTFNDGTRIMKKADAMKKIKEDSTEEYTTGTNQKIRVHKADKCKGEFCCIHNPSDHVMKDFPTHWRDDRGLMERICPHGVGHPDPDDLAYKDKMGGDKLSEAVHGCDGCCLTGEEKIAWNLMTKEEE